MVLSNLLAVMLYFSLPLVIFLGKNGIYNETSLSGSLGIPVSFILAPLSLYFLPKVRSNFIFISMLLFLFFCFILSIFGAYIDKTALLYWLQNAVPALWFFAGYIYIEKSRQDKVKLFNAFSTGLAISIFWVLASFLMEFFTVGFSGRISQNATLPGFYQTYNYLPSAIALSLGLWLYFSLDTQEKSDKRFFVVIGGLFAVILTGSRGPLVSILLVLLLYGMYTKKFKVYIKIIIAITMAIFVSMKFMGDFSMLEKMDQAITSDNLTEVSSGRDKIASKYIGLIHDAPALGTLYLPPSIYNPHSEITDKSAHNYYIDTIVRTGLVGFSIFMIFAFSILLASFKIFKSRHLAKYQVLPSLIIIMEFLVSFNLRVPLKQPITASLIYFIIGLISAQVLLIKCKKHS